MEKKYHTLNDKACPEMKTISQLRAEKKPRITRLRDTIVTFGKFKGKTFMEIALLEIEPEELTEEEIEEKKEKGEYVNKKGWKERGITYLDWLSGDPTFKNTRKKNGIPIEQEGQIKLYGLFKKRLLLFLAVPCIQRLLDEAIIDPEDDSRQPTFIPSQQGAREGTHPSRHHSVGILCQVPARPFSDEIPALKKQATGFSFHRACKVLVDAITFIEQKFTDEQYDPADLLELDLSLLKKAGSRVMNNPVPSEEARTWASNLVRKLRSQYKAYRKVVSKVRRRTTSDPCEYMRRMRRRARPQPLRCKWKASLD